MLAHAMRTQQHAWNVSTRGRYPDYTITVNVQAGILGRLNGLLL